MVLVQNSLRGEELNIFCPPNSSDDLCPFFFPYTSLLYSMLNIAPTTVTSRFFAEILTPCGAVEKNSSEKITPKTESSPSMENILSRTCAANTAGDRRGSHCNDRDSHSHDRDSHGNDRGSHSNDRGSHSNDRGSHSNDRDCHSVEKNSHTKNENCRSKDKDSHSKSKDRHTIEKNSHGKDKSSHSKEKGSHSKDKDNHSKDKDSPPRDPNRHKTSPVADHSISPATEHSLERVNLAAGHCPERGSSQAAGHSPERRLPHNNEIEEEEDEWTQVKVLPACTNPNILNFDN